MFVPSVVAMALATLTSLSEPGKTMATAGLSLSGQITNVKLLEENTSSVVIEISLDLTLRNHSNANIILYWHDFDLVGSRIFRVNEKGQNEVLYRLSTLASSNRSPEWTALQKLLNTRGPKPELTRLLKPGQSITLKKITGLRIYKNKKIFESSWGEIIAASPLWMTVELDMFPSNLDRTSISQKSFGRKLQKRWKPFGSLQLESLQSESIRLDLSNL